MKKEPKILLEKAIETLVLSTELFNRPSDIARSESVLILLDHSFEMLLKATILHRGGKIREPRARETMGFDKCLRVAFSGKQKFLSESQVLTLQAINGLRDAAQHYLLDISEQHLYMQTQAGLTLFKDIYHKVFRGKLSEHIPERVLPLSTKVPTTLSNMFEEEVEEVRRLLKPGKRHKTEAIAKLRALAILEGATQGEKLQPDTTHLRKLATKLRLGKKWTDIFPGVACIDLTSVGHGPSIDLRFTKKEGVPIHVVPEGTPGASIVGIKRVSELDYYNLGHKQVADHLKLTQPKATALIWHTDLKSDPECFKRFRVGATGFSRYSQKAIDVLKKALKKNKIEAVWKAYRAKGG